MSAATHLAATPTIYEPCEECGAALDPQQRYCVNCAARRPSGGANPSSRYFASMSKRARRPVAARAPGRQPSSSRAAAVGFFALLPIAVAIGVVVGRSDSGGGDEQALLQALREQRSNGAVASTAAGTTETGGRAKGKGGAAKSNERVQRKTGKPKEEVAAKTKNGTVHQVTGYNPSKKTIEESTKLVEENTDQTGSNYIEDQQNLPDVIPVGPSTGGGK